MVVKGLISWTNRTRRQPPDSPDVIHGVVDRRNDRNRAGATHFLSESDYNAAMNDRLKTLMKFFEKDPRDTFATYAIAMEHRKAGDLEEAVVWFDRTLDIEPDHGYAHYHKAVTLSDLGRADEALITAKAGLEQAIVAGDEKASNELRELIAALSE